MNRALDLRSREQAGAAVRVPMSSLLKKAEVLREPSKDFDVNIEEVLIQIIEAIPTLPDGFSGLYQSFHLLRDLLGFDKLMILTPVQSDPERLETLGSVGFDETSRTRFSMRTTDFDPDLRYARLPDAYLENLSSKDREGTEHPYYLLSLGMPRPTAVFLGCGAYTSLQEQGTPILGPIRQVLNQHIERFVSPPRQPARTAFIPAEDLVRAVGSGDFLIELSAGSLTDAVAAQYPDIAVSRIFELIQQKLVGYLPDDSLVSKEDGRSILIYVPAPFPRVQSLVADQLAGEMARWFSVDLDEPCAAARTATA